MSTQAELVLELKATIKAAKAEIKEHLEGYNNVLVNENCVVRTSEGLYALVSKDANGENYVQPVDIMQASYMTIKNAKAVANAVKDMPSWKVEVVNFKTALKEEIAHCETQLELLDKVAAGL